LVDKSLARHLNERKPLEVSKNLDMFTLRFDSPRDILITIAITTLQETETARGFS
jgi:hypothetical protein